MTYWLGLDVGSSSIKGGLFDLDRETVVRVEQRPFPDPIDPASPAIVEIDAGEIIGRIEEVLEAIRPPSADVRGLVVSSQMGGVILGDRQGQARSPYYSWRDQRVMQRHPREAGSFWEGIVRRTRYDDLQRVGNELRPGSATSLLYWLAETKQLPEPPTVAMQLGDYVVAALTKTPPRTEYTLALGIVDLTQHALYTDWFARLGLADVEWPALVDVGEALGTWQPATATTTGPARPIPCYPAIGDHQASLWGTDLRLGELSINVSTGSQTSMLSPTFQAGTYQSRYYLNDQFLRTITHLPAGRALNGLVDLLSALARAEGYELRDPWRTVRAAVEETGPSDLDVDLAFFTGPMGYRGHIRSIRLENLTVGHLFRAAFQNMADNYWNCAKQLCPEKDWTRVVLSGGLPQKLPTLRQLIEQRFACPVRFVSHEEETLIGLLKLARRLM